MRLSTYLQNNKEKYNVPEDSDLSVYDDIEINIDEGMDTYDTNVRRPYYRLRGKPVTEEQAFEVIRRTDRIFSRSIKLPADSDYIDGYHLHNWWFNRNHFPSDMGWIHRDGTLGGNGITDKYPNFKQLMFEVFGLINEFPYLDFVWVITEWNECPDEIREHLWDKDEAMERKHKFEEYDGFYEAIEIGLWVHDNTIDVLEPKRAAEKFKEYEEKYGVADPSYYSAYYNMRNNIVPCDLEYLKRCIEAYGLNAEEALKGVYKGVLEVRNKE